jgi:hypothetical protein
MTEAIPYEQAVALCAEAVARNRKRWWDPRSLQCWGCLRFSSDVAHRCFSSAAGNRGCPFINDLADHKLHG